jgi:hypothetical protein
MLKHRSTHTVIKIFLALGILVGALFAVLSMSAAVPEGSPTVATSVTQTPNVGLELPLVPLTGKWVAESNGTQFIATVDNSNITIDIVNDGVSVTYWNGTFSTSESPGATITSNVIDPDRMVLSNAVSKDFGVQKDQVTFDFTVMSMTKKVVMTRG